MEHINSLFIVSITYLKPLTEIEKFVDEHRAYLDLGYQQNILIASGPKNPRTGGIILANTKNRQQLEDFLSNDPFIVKNLIKYEIIEFFPIKVHPIIKKFLV